MLFYCRSLFNKSVYSVVGAVALVGCTEKKPLLNINTPVQPVTKPAAQSDGPSSEIPERREFPVNAAVNPCDNFYEYACSAPVAKFKLRDDRSRHIFTFNDSSERLLTKKTAFLEKMITRNDLSPRAQQLKDNYLACMNTTARATEEDSILAVVTERLAASNNRDGVLSFLDRVESNHGLVQLNSDANMDDPLKYDLVPYPAVMTFPDKGMYTDPAAVEDLRVVYEKFLNVAGIADAKARSEAVVKLEAKLAESHLTPTEQRLRETEPRYKTMKEFVAAYPRLLSDDLQGAVPATTLVRDLYSEAMNAIATALAEEELQTLKDFILVRLLAFEIEVKNAAYHADVLAFSAKHLGGAPIEAPLKERCTSMVMNDFGKELDAEVLPELFPNFDKEKFVDMTNRVRASIVKRLENNKWMSDAGKEGALKKMKTAKLQVVRPDTDEEWGFIETRTYSPDEPLSNKYQRRQTQLENLIKGLRDGRNPAEWHIGPLIVNAYYNPADNQFVMPQGILQYPFYDPEGPEAANFGAVGVVVGHELGHGVDDQGSQYDEFGVHREWMPKEDRDQFKLLTQILVKQFNAIAPKEINAKYGELTLGENIADASGLVFAHGAAFPDNVGSLADKKAFYLQYARVWCGVMRPKEFERRLRVDPHAQTESRVNLPLMHQPGFYEAYECKAGDKMYMAPEERMSLW